MTPYLTPASVSPVDAPGRRPFRAMLAIWKRRILNRRQLRRDLTRLTDELLIDAGCTRHSLETEATRPFWRPLKPELWEVPPDLRRDLDLPEAPPDRWHNMRGFF